MNHIIYCRVSTNNQVNSLEVQYQACKNYIGSNPFKKKIVDKCSGWNKIPPGWGQLLCFKNCVIVISAVDRIGRRYSEVIPFMRKLLNKNEVVFVRENIKLTKNSLKPTNPNWQKFEDYVKRASYESQVLAYRVKQTKEHLRKKGHFTGKLPYGFSFKFVNGAKKLIKDHDEHDIIRLIIMMRTPGISLSVINKILATQSEDFKPLILGRGVTNEEWYQTSEVKLTEPLYYKNIATILNDYGIYNRGREWTASYVSSLYKKHNESEPSIQPVYDGEEHNVDDLLKSLKKFNVRKVPRWIFNKKN